MNTVSLLRLAAAALIATLAALLATAATSAAAQPKLVAAGSEVAFTSKQMGVPVDGRFRTFDAQVAFDPKAPAAASVKFNVALASVSIGTAEVEAELAKPDWFDAGAFPQAQFASSAVKVVGPGRIEVAGRLSIKGASRELVVPVVLAAGAGGRTTATGSFALRRTEFRIGAGEWGDTSLVADEVQVRLKLVFDGLAIPMKPGAAWIAAALLATLAAFGGDAHAQSVAYTVDPTHTFVHFEVKRGPSVLRARFDRKQGSVEIDRAAARGRIEFGIEVASLNSGSALLDALLAGPMVFDAAAFPTARFVADTLRFDGEAVVEASGTLTLRDRTLPVTLSATRSGCYLNPLFRRQVCGGDFEAKLDARAFGIAAGSLVDEVRLIVQVEAIRP